MYYKKDLISLWEKEKLAYQTKEIGSGVQFFVKKLLQCPEIFNLKEANLSTPEQDRRNEFLEESSKKSKRADVIIYIDNQIVIPMEIERYGNIQAGEKQLFAYQLVWDKKAGILTDGFEWVFYIGKTPVRKFTLPTIFEKTAEFLVFWKEYAQPINYYLNFFQTSGQSQIFQEDDLNIEENRQNFFIDITTLINSFQHKLNLKGYFQRLDSKYFEKQAIELTYAYLIQFILYKTLVDNNFEDFKSDFEQRILRIEKNLNTHNFSDILTVTKFISDLVSKNIYKPFKSEQEIINQTLNDILAKPTNNLADVTPWLDIFAFIKRYSFANIRNEIFGFIYENYLKQLYNENLGQYFTTPEIVDFMLEEIGYQGRELLKNSQKNAISIIDPSCGSGTFLYSAVRNLIESLPAETKEASEQIEKLINENIFGVDVSEFPLYLAEMSIIMRMLPLILNEDYTNVLDKKIKAFKTKDSIAEFLDTAVKNTLYDIHNQLVKSKGQGIFDFGSINLDYKSHVRDEDDLKDLKRSLENQGNPKIDRYRFDYVIGNPPYISYNESSSKGVLFFEFLKQKKVKLSDVYGINLHSVPDNIKTYPPKPNLYSFFIALGLGLLKDGGKLCYIIPQTLLTESDYDVLRYHFSKYTTIEKIITFNNSLFTGRGLKQKNTVATSSLILIIKKQMPTHAHKVKIVNYEGIDKNIADTITNIKKGAKTAILEVKQGLLLKDYLNWNFIKQDSSFIDFYNAYKFTNSQSLASYYEHKLAKKEFGTEFFFDVGFILDKDEIKKERDSDNFELVDFSRFLGYFNFDAHNFYPKDLAKIELPKNSQGHQILQKKFKIVWNKERFYKFYFTDRPILPNMSSQQIICSDNEDEMLYLFALLNSPINEFIFKKLFQLNNEKSGLFIVIRRIKEFIKIPVITSENRAIKDNIILKVRDLFSTERVNFTDLVDFSNVLVQKFDSLEIEGNFLLLRSEGNITKCNIKKNKELVEIFVKSNTKNLTLKNLKNALIIDENKHVEIKKEIDDLVFCLYFNVQLTDLKQDKYYQYLQK
jgi:hypothetical protein